MFEVHRENGELETVSPEVWLIIYAVFLLMTRQVAFETRAILCCSRETGLEMPSATMFCVVASWRQTLSSRWHEGELVVLP